MTLRSVIGFFDIRISVFLSSFVIRIWELRFMGERGATACGRGKSEWSKRHFVDR